VTTRTPIPVADTRQRILQIATELFREHGYAGTSIRDIADELGMTKAALYYHFSCKDDILQALIAPTMAAIEEFLQKAERSPDPDPAQLLREFAIVLSRTVSTVATCLGDPVVLRTQAGQFRLPHLQTRLLTVIAGPDADEARLLRARAAIGAIKATMETLAPGCAGDPLTIQRNVDRHLDTIVAAALGALQG
jgi:AcrR family transcriptional regulator